MWRIVRQFIIVLHLALGDPSIGHALPQNRAVGSEFQPLTSIKENSVITSTKLKMNLSDTISTGKPQLVSTYSSWETRTILRTTMMKPASKSMLKDTPVIFRNKSDNNRPEFNPAKRFTMMTNPKPPTGVRACQKITAGALCEDDLANYPKEFARNLSRDYQFKSQYQPYFWSPTNEVMTEEAGSDISTRLNADPIQDGKAICAVKEDFKFVKPKLLRDRSDNWRYILQPDTNNYTQVVQVEICADPHGNCQTSLGDSYECKCIQKFSYRKLVWITDDNKYGVDDFIIPSCCSCRYYTRNDDSIGFRMSSIHSQKSGG